MKKKYFLKVLAKAGVLAINFVAGYATVKTTSEIYAHVIECIEKKGGDR